MALQRVLLLLCLLSHAWAATRVSSLVPTNTYCPVSSATPARPTPTAQVCAVAGTLSKPSLLNAYCRDSIVGLGNVYPFNDTCYRACARDAKCVSYSVDPAHSVCYTYGKSLASQRFKVDTRKYHFFTDIRTCYNCTSPAPAQLACNQPAQPLSKPSSQYICGANGTIRYFDPDAVYSDFLYYSDPSECYKYCVQDFDPVGQCVSYAVDFQSNYCVIYDKPLINTSFKLNKTGTARAWNLHGCYNCSTPTTSATTCQPTTTPLNVGARNGNFQGPTYTSNSITIPTEWSLLSYRTLFTVVQRPNGNKFLSIPSVSNSDGVLNCYLTQTVYGLVNDPNSPNRFYNFSFDVAIPSHSIQSNGTYPCTLGYPSNWDENYRTAQLQPDNPKFQGTTLKTFGPYLVDASRYVDVTFSTSCFVNEPGAGASNATYWIDNFRITQNGRDIGK